MNRRIIEENVNPIAGPIEHDGSLLIKGNVESGSEISATEDIEILGHVHNAKIRSLKGNIVIHSGIQGAQTVIQAIKGNVTAAHIQNATIKAEGDIIITGMIMDAILIAKHSIYAQTREGNIEGGELEAGHDIISYNLGNVNSKTTIIRISDFKQRELYNKMLSIEQEIKILKIDKTKLEKYIQIIKILGNKVVNLPLEKKQDLAQKVQDYQKISKRINELEFINQNLFQPEEEIDELERSVIVRGQLFNGVRVMIDKARLDVQKTYKNIILYKRGIIIVGDYDQFMHRKKYS